MSGLQILVQVAAFPLLAGGTGSASAVKPQRGGLGTRSRAAKPSNSVSAPCGPPHKAPVVHAGHTFWAWAGDYPRPRRAIAPLGRSAFPSVIADRAEEKSHGLLREARIVCPDDRERAAKD